MTRLQHRNRDAWLCLLVQCQLAAALAHIQLFTVASIAQCEQHNKMYTAALVLQLQPYNTAKLFCLFPSVLDPLFLHFTEIKFYYFPAVTVQGTAVKQEANHIS